MLGREPEPSIHRALASALLLLLSPPPTPTFPSQGLVASAAPGQDCIILGFVCRAAGGGARPPAPCPPPLSSPALSWVLLLLPLFSGPWHPGIVCLTW